MTGKLKGATVDMELVGKLLKLVPTLVIYGEHDIVTEEGTIAALCKHIPHATVHKIKDCSHYAHLEQSAEFFKCVNAFFSSSAATMQQLQQQYQLQQQEASPVKQKQQQQ